MKVSVNSTKIFGLILILFFVNSVKSQTSETIYTLRAGTQIDARMDNEINSKVSSADDTFTVTVSKPVTNREVEVLPIGTILEGRIIKVKSAGLGGKEGSFEVRFETLKLPNGAKRQIDGSLINSENPKPPRIFKTAAIAGGTAAGALVGALAGKGRGTLIGAGTGLGIGMSAILLQRGKETRIKAEQQVTVILNREVTLPAEDF